MGRKPLTKTGSLDVRNEKDVAELEKTLSIGPITLVLVYADWCGHCNTFKKEMWNNVPTVPNKTVNTASVHYDMLDKTSLSNAKIEGYPSLLLVGTDKKPADFKDEEGVKTNAMPMPQSPAELTNIVTAPVPQPVKNANSVAEKISNLRNASVPSAAPAPVSAPVSVPPSMGLEPIVTPESVSSGSVAAAVEAAEATPRVNTMKPNTVSMMNSVRPNSMKNNKQNNVTLPKVIQIKAPSYIPEESSALGVPPDPLSDLVETQSKRMQSGGSNSHSHGGGLYAALLAVTREATPAAVLLAAAALKAKRNGKKTRRSTRRKSSKTMRRRR